MVRLLNDKNIELVVNGICFVYNLQRKITRLIAVNPPKVPCVYAMWHAHLNCLYGLEPEVRKKTNIMISTSKDGDIITNSINKLFEFKFVRGSSARKGAVESTMQLITLLKQGESAAIMVDGPRGPRHKVKKGAIKIAKKSGVPIIPATWYTSNFNLVKFPSWDRWEIPLGPANMITLFGEPIYVPQDGNDEDDEKIRLQVENSLLELDNKAKDEFNKLYWHGLWLRK